MLPAFLPPTACPAALLLQRGQAVAPPPPPTTLASPLSHPTPHPPTPPTRTPLLQFPDVAKGKTAVGRVFALIDRTPLIDNMSDEGLAPEACTGLVALHKVTFAYPSRPNVRPPVGVCVVARVGLWVGTWRRGWGCGKVSVCTPGVGLWLPGAPQHAPPFPFPPSQPPHSPDSLFPTSPP